MAEIQDLHASSIVIDAVCPLVMDDPAMWIGTARAA